MNCCRRKGGEKILKKKIISFGEKKLYIYIYIYKTVGSQIVAHTQMETGDGPKKPNTINL